MRHKTYSSGKADLYCKLMRAYGVVAVLLGKAISWFAVHVLLVIIFYSVFVPVGFIMRTIGSDPLCRKYDSTLKSYRGSSSGRDLDHMDRSF